MPAPRTLVEKIWRDHLVAERPDGTVLLYVDRLLLHEVDSPQAFAAVRRPGGRVHRPEPGLAMADHDLPTADRARGIADPRARLQVETLAANCREFGVPHLSPRDPRHGITRVVGPEQGLILPGMTAVCCDSHATTYGALGALGFGIGASDLEFVLRARTLIQRPPRTLRLQVEGTLGPGLSAKDLILSLVGRLGAGGGAGYAIEFAGPAVRALSLEGRMTLCNMAIEAGARAGLVAPDDSTAAYLSGRPLAPRGRLWEQALAHWRELRSDPDAVFDRELAVRVDGLVPQVTWGTSPEQALPITGRVPDPAAAPDGASREAGSRALAYMGLVPGAALEGVGVDQVFIGSCTNGRIEDLRAAAGGGGGRRGCGGSWWSPAPGR